jgi:hypothetical protein
MRRSTVPILAIALLIPSFSAGAAVRRDVRVEVFPHERSIRVSAVLTSSAGTLGPRIPFLLHGGLSPETSTPGVLLRRMDRPPSPGDFATSEDTLPLPVSFPVEFWELRLEPGVSSVSLTYGGIVDHPVKEEGEDYARSFGETPGTVAPEGVFLAGSSHWVPWIGDGPFPFSLEVKLPPGWDAVSQGARIRHERHESGTEVTWDSPEPQTEIYLVAAPFVETSRNLGRIEAMVFLRERDDALAGKYLDATKRYVRMYEKLLGPYPYSKFALVENFWETGYGMPSFTLLGPTVIRLPFIVNSSYPHEILHNWWGNGVYVDETRGNWCEGLTAYLADHLLREQSGDASEYRQTTLQKYADYVSRDTDFPLSEFRERHSPSTEAVGYGKALMFFHELRRDLGDELFVKSLRRFYADHRFREASFDDLRGAFESESGRDLADRFAQVVDRAGAARLELQEVSSRPHADGWVVEGTLTQTQSGDPFSKAVPMTITVEEGRPPVETTLELSGRSIRFSIPVPGKPLRIDVDPFFDLFRRLDPRETPPALTRAFGSERAVVLLPTGAEPAQREAYRALAEAWAAAEPGRIEIRDDLDVRSIPQDRSVWVFGIENERAGWVAGALRMYAVDLRADRLRVGSFDGTYDDVAVALVGPHPSSASLATVLVTAARPEQVPGLGRKLPHYHKYSFVVFEGDEPTNVAKGRWPVLSSPLTRFLEGGRVNLAGVAPRPALAVPPPVFSVERIRATVEALSASEMEGREPGNPGHERAAAWIENAFREAGLVPARGGEGSFADSWEQDAGDPARTIDFKNLVGQVSGTSSDLRGEVVVVVAHYDHLGRGWPEVREGNQGVLHPGADDNASGVAALVELARSFGSGPPPDRTILFAAFDGEEAGRVGSQRLVERLRKGGVSIHSMINLDSVGRLGDGKVLVLGSGSASEWVHVFRGAGFVTGYPVESVSGDPGGSDQVSFQEAGVPAVQLFTGPHLDYHSPGDTADKVDADGIAKVVAVAREAVEYLAGRSAPLTNSKGGAGTAEGRGQARRVSLGTVPDFSYEGPGVRLDGVVPGSPAENAGLAKGDVVVGLGEATVHDLRSFSEALRGLSPGTRVTVRFTRDGERFETEAELEAR